MKKTASILFAIILCRLLVSCDSGWPYKPVEFIAPTLPPPEHAFVSKDSVASFCGTDNVILLYNYSIPGIMLQTIFFVNFNDSDATPVKLKKPAGRENWKADSPIPSPDGKLVTYFMFSATGEFAAYIQKLDSTSEPVLIAEPASEPHFYKDAGGDLFVTYADINGILFASLDSITSHATFKQQVDTLSGQKIGEPTQLADKPFYGGLSRDGRYLCTGYANAYFYDLTDSSLHPVNSGLQTCNPSISTDPILTDRMMFLNFAGVQNMNNYPRTPVDQHKVIFIVDKDNNAVSSFDVNDVLGASKGEWQDPEWSNNPDYFAAVASDGGIYDVYIVNINTGKALRMNNPDNFRANDSSTPFLFIGGGEL